MLPRQFMDKLKFIKIVTPLRPGFIFRTIVIDPGHGGKDPGAISHNGLKEKNLNLTISKYIKEGLEKQGFKVILTRTKDTYLTLLDRVRIAKKNKADLFISIHTNSNRSRQINGIEVYYLSPSRLNSSERAMKLARSEDFEGKKLPIEVKTILWDLVITKNYSYSVEFSEILYSTFKKLGFSVTAPKKAPYYVLRFAYVPSVLLEIGYLSNRYEEKALRKQTYQKQIAQAVILAAVSLTERYGSFAKNTSDNK
jgi:N-acetylmuramoyl-L-alanine amidase